MKKIMVMLMALCLCGFTSGIVQADEAAPVKDSAKQACQVEAKADSVHGNIVDAVKGDVKCDENCKCDCCKKDCTCGDCPKCKGKCAKDCSCGCKEGKPCTCGEKKADSVHGNIVDAVKGDIKCDENCKCDCCKKDCTCGDCPKCKGKCDKDCSCGCNEGKPCTCGEKKADSVHGNIVDAVKGEPKEIKTECQKGCKCKSKK